MCRWSVLWKPSALNALRPYELTVHVYTRHSCTCTHCLHRLKQKEDLTSASISVIMCCLFSKYFTTSFRHRLQLSSKHYTSAIVLCHVVIGNPHPLLWSNMCSLVSRTCLDTFLLCTMALSDLHFFDQAHSLDCGFSIYSLSHTLLRHNVIILGLIHLWDIWCVKASNYDRLKPKGLKKEKQTIEPSQRILPQRPKKDHKSDEKRQRMKKVTKVPICKQN